MLELLDGEVPDDELEDSLSEELELPSGELLEDVVLELPEVDDADVLEPEVLDPSEVELVGTDGKVPDWEKTNPFACIADFENVGICQKVCLLRAQ